MKQKIKASFFITVFTLFSVISVYADIKLPALIDNNMVIQRDTTARIWGWADPGERITVALENSKKTVIAGADGQWSVNLDPMKAGGPYDMAIAGNNTIVLHNILVGDVWICSGQSNMQWPVKFSANPEEEITNGNHSMIRLFTVQKRGSGEPQEYCEGQWAECSSRNVGDFSAVGYYFGRNLQEELDVPIGLIQSAWGGTPIETWISLDGLKSEPSLSYVIDGWEEVIGKKPKEMERYYDLLSAWFVYCFECMGQKKSYGEIPTPPDKYNKGLWVPSWLYNAMIAPLSNFSIKGFAWYQGESNASHAYQYRTLLPTLIKDWRRSFKEGDLPFLIVQLANVDAHKNEPTESDYAELREAQSMATKLPKTGITVTLDLGEANDVHYKNKQEVGKRLALNALKIAYGRDIVYSGPVYESMKVKGNKAYLHFTHTGGGLCTPKGEPLNGFAIAGQDSVFVWAVAEIKGNDIEVWSNEVEKPLAIRYAWQDNPMCNLYNKEGLPASSFRTDNWPGITK